MQYVTAPPVNLFAHRHTYLGSNPVTPRDLGFVVGLQVGASRCLKEQSLLPNYNQTSGSTSHTESLQTQEDLPPIEYESPQIWDSDRKRWEGSRRYHPQIKEDCDAPLPRATGRDWEEEEKVVLPPMISWFVEQLPSPTTFDG